jgi:hypothetical protein
MAAAWLSLSTNTGKAIAILQQVRQGQVFPIQVDRRITTPSGLFTSPGVPTPIPTSGR